MSASRNRNWPVWIAGLLIGALVSGVVIGLQQSGAMQYLEFPAYDWMIRHRPPAMADDPRIAIIAITENDIQSPALDYPMWDDKMAQLLQQIEAQRPRVIGLDIYRDLPVPRNGAHHQELSAVLQSNANIICIWSLGDARSPEIKPPPALRDLPERIGSNDLIDDFDGAIRRAVLYQDYHGVVVECFPMCVARTYLDGEGIQPTQDLRNAAFVRLGRTTLTQFKGNDGAYVRPKMGGYQILHDFKGPRSFRTYKLGDVFANSVPADAFRDKIVLVGMESISVPDLQITPLQPQHASVEVHALAVNQLLRAALNGDRLLRHWADWQEWAWTVFWCLVGTAVGYRVRSPWRSCALIAAMLAVLGWVVWRAFLADLWLMCAAPAIGTVGSAGLISLYISYHEERQRKLIERVLGTQVSPKVAETILQHIEDFVETGRIPPQKLTATVLFADLKGFTASSEKLDPGQVMDWLNEYMSAMAKLVTQHDGLVEKFIGDQVMAVFGIPVQRTTESEIKQDAASAVRCALAMERELQRLNAEWEQRRLPVTGMRVGIHTGDLVAGSLGNIERMEYTVLGDTVNTASRLESLAEETADPEFADRCSRTLISESTRKLLDGQFQTKLVGTMNLKGKKEPISIHRVIGEVPRAAARASTSGLTRAAVLLTTLCLILSGAFNPTRTVGQVAASAPEPTNRPPATAVAAEPTNQPPAAVAPARAPNLQAPPAVSPVKVVFKPPLGSGSVADQPGRRRGGARGSGLSLIVLDVLAPENTGLTTQESPTLYWYQSAAVDVPFELAVLVENQAQPVLKVRWEGARHAGIQKLRLSDLNVKLQPGIEYEWVVALVVDPESRSKDVIASGYIQRVDSSAALRARISGAGGVEKSALLAEQGLWYDALETLSDLVETQPNNKEFLSERASLLEQVDLTNAAAYASATVKAE